MREKPNLCSGRGVAGGTASFQNQSIIDDVDSLEPNRLQQDDNKLKIHSVHGTMSVHQGPHRQGIHIRGRILGYNV